MTSRDFAFWLQGYFEILGTLKSDDQGGQIGDKLTMAQVKCIKNHLNLVFKHDIDPSMGDAKQQQELKDIHEGGIDLRDPLSQINC
jgi:hypothetical protein